MARGVGYPSEVYEAAFELWAFYCDQNPKKTSARLAAQETPVPWTVVRYWAVQHHWHERRRERLRNEVPGLHYLNLVHLAYGSTEGFMSLRSVARGEQRNVSQVAVRNEIAASIALVDRAGYAPRHVDVSGQRRPDIPSIAQDLELGDDQVAAMILGQYIDVPALGDGRERANEEVGVVEEHSPAE